MIRYEYMILFSKRVNKFILAVLLILTIVLSSFAIWSVSYLDQKGVEHTGLTASRKLAKIRNEWSGKLDTSVISKVLQIDRNVRKKYGENPPNEVYANTEQSYTDIKDMIVSILCYDKEFDEAVIDNFDFSKTKNIYDIREKNIKREIAEYGRTQSQKRFLREQYSKVTLPFKYEAAESWKTMDLYATTFNIILLIAISFLVAGIFSDEFRLQTDSIFFTSKCGRNIGTRAKIAAGLMMTTFIYWGFMLLFSVISFGVMGISGFNSPIQIEYSYSLYPCTFLQRYLIILLAGYIGCILAAVTAMLISAKTHSSLIAICIPFILFVVSPFIGRALPFKEFFNVTPDQLLNV